MSAEVIDLFSKRAQLEAHLDELTKHGNSLLRLGRQCSMTANEIFDEADVIRRQLEAMPC